jgi:hypothetical protein
MTITKNQKMLLGVGAVAVAGYLVYQQMNKKMNVIGRTRMGGTRSGTSDICGEGCVDGKCRFPYYDEFGNVSYLTTTCKGTGESGGYGTTILQGSK